jgi:preprotein translocase subunit SecA
MEAVGTEAAAVLATEVHHMILPTDDYRCAKLPKMRQVVSGLDAMASGFMGRWAGRSSLLDDYRVRAAAIVEKTNALQALEEDKFKEQIRQSAGQFRFQKVSPEFLDDTLSLLGEAARRSLGMQPYPVQIMGALALYDGYLAEMATGEGKSLTACLPAILAGWSGNPCHVLTSNDYLAQRDAEDMAVFYHYCDLSVGWVTDGMEQGERSSQYKKNVVYTTSKELLGDFLRDRLRMGNMGAAGRRLIQRLLHWPTLPGDGLVLRGLHTAIVDEADSILIDEAVIPFIISAPRENPVLVEAVLTANRVVRRLRRGRDYRVGSKRGSIRLTKQGERLLERLAHRLPGMWKGKERRLELVMQALQAREMYQQDKHFVILEGKVVLVDELTGRLTPNRSLGIGLHQALEAAHKVELSPPTETMARFSYQKFFRLFPSLCGMSGTIHESVEELWRMYGLAVLPIPTHRDIKRKQLLAMVFRSQQEKWSAVVEEVVKIHSQGRPVLVGTRSVDSSEAIAKQILARGLHYRLLNAVRHKDEAEIITNAGKKNYITIATNMAGRGTDIKLGEGVRELGGLCVIAAEPNESSRIDRQLYGRSGRQGDPGSAQLFYSLDDPIFRRFLPKIINRFLLLFLVLRLPGDNWLAGIILDWAQGRAERWGFKQRRAILRADQWLEESMAFSNE